MNVKVIEMMVKECYLIWSKSYYDDYYGEKVVYFLIYCDLIRLILFDVVFKMLLDVGCGLVLFFCDMMDMSIELFGFDLMLEMVDEGKCIFVEFG